MVEISRKKLRFKKSTFKEELVDGPQNAWTGYYSLAKQGIKIDDFETYIAENAPLKFTDPKVRFVT